MTVAIDVFSCKDSNPQVSYPCLHSRSPCWRISAFVGNTVSVAVGRVWESKRGVFLCPPKTWENIITLFPMGCQMYGRLFTLLPLPSSWSSFPTVFQHWHTLSGVGRGYKKKSSRQYPVQGSNLDPMSRDFAWFTLFLIGSDNIFFRSDWPRPCGQLFFSYRKLKISLLLWPQGCFKRVALCSRSARWT